MTSERFTAALLSAVLFSCAIAGVAFVVVSAGAGLVILAPAVLLAAPSAGPEPFMAGVSP